MNSSSRWRERLHQRRFFRRVVRFYGGFNGSLSSDRMYFRVEIEITILTINFCCVIFLLSCLVASLLAGPAERLVAQTGILSNWPTASDRAGFEQLGISMHY